jgi:hypothetical protein
MPAPPPKTTQLPSGKAVFLDHVGHFIDDPQAAAGALARAGFAPAPVSIQTNPDPTGGAPRLTGTGNVCAMLQQGYLEVLFKTAETPLAAEFDLARARYSGLHLVAFAVADANATHDRLAASGFAMQPLVRMQRPVGTPTGESVAAFEVVRLAPGQMPEGRIQMLQHRTEDTVWQPRWLSHPNSAKGLVSLTIVEEDIDAAATRFTRFTDRTSEPHPMGRRIRLDRGELILATADAWRRRWPDHTLPRLPYMGEYTIEVASIDTARRVLGRGGFSPQQLGDTLAVPFPTALGRGLWNFTGPP